MNNNIDFFKQVKVVEYNKEIYKKNNIDTKAIDYKFLIAFRDGLAYKIQEKKKYKLIKNYIENGCSYFETRALIDEAHNISGELKILNKFIQKEKYYNIYIYIVIRNIIKKLNYKIKNKTYK